MYFGIYIVTIKAPHLTIWVTNLTARVGLSTSRLRQTRLHNLFSFDLKKSILALVLTIQVSLLTVRVHPGKKILKINVSLPTITSQKIFGAILGFSWQSC